MQTDITSRFIENYLIKANSILIVSPILPDGDGIGSQIALMKSLLLLGKKVAGVHEEVMVSKAHFILRDEKINSCLYTASEYMNIHSEDAEVDLTVILGTHSQKELGLNSQKLLSLSKEFVFIDNNSAPAPIAALHCIDTKASCLSEIVGDIIYNLPIKIDSFIAEALYWGLVSKTSFFQTSKVSAQTHKFASRLLQYGFKPQLKYLNAEQDIKYYKVLGHLFTLLQTSQKIAWLEIKENDLCRFHFKPQHVLDLAESLKQVRGIQFLLVFKQSSKKSVHIYIKDVQANQSLDLVTSALGGVYNNSLGEIKLRGNTADCAVQLIDKLEKIFSSQRLQNNPTQVAGLLTHYTFKSRS